MMIRKTWGGAAGGVGSGVGSGAPPMGVGLRVGVASAVDFGAQAARRQAETTRATNRILSEPTIQPLNAAEKWFVGSGGEAGAWGPDHLAAPGPGGAAGTGDRDRRSGCCGLRGRRGLWVGRDGADCGCDGEPARSWGGLAAAVAGGFCDAEFGVHAMRRARGAVGARSAD